MPPTAAPTSSALPAVPLTLEGAAVLHQIFKIRWSAWRQQDLQARHHFLQQLDNIWSPLEKDGRSGLFSLLGHKGDLMAVHFRDSLDQLNDIELQLARAGLFEFFEPVHSYVSVVELGLYESTSKVYGSLSEKGIAPHSEDWNREIEETLVRQREAMKPRLFPTIPDARYVCFYPMDRKRGESKNWYMLPMSDRQRMMREHGEVGRRYAGTVKQIISGSIGLDDWEWGVTLFADDPVVFKRLIYEMRFDEVSADYALFGQFFVGIHLPGGKVGELLEGKSA